MNLRLLYGVLSYSTRCFLDSKETTPVVFRILDRKLHCKRINNVHLNRTGGLSRTLY